MATFEKFEEIISWKEARQLNRSLIYLIKNRRFENDYRLINQIVGSAGSIMDNIAEGFERGGNKEFVQFLYIAKGSCGEFRSQVYRALDNGYITESEFEILSTQAKKINFLIQKLITYLKFTGIKGHKFKES
jgi:four helix bundle protein